MKFEKSSFSNFPNWSHGNIDECNSQGCSFRFKTPIPSTFPETLTPPPPPWDFTACLPLETVNFSWNNPFLRKYIPACTSPPPPYGHITMPQHNAVFTLYSVVFTSAPNWLGPLLTHFCRWIGKSEKGFAKRFSWTAVFFLLIMRVHARPLFLRTVFQILFRISQSNDKKGNPKNLDLDFLIKIHPEDGFLGGEIRFRISPSIGKSWFRF